MLDNLELIEYLQQPPSHPRHSKGNILNLIFANLGLIICLSDIVMTS